MRNDSCMDTTGMVAVGDGAKNQCDSGCDVALG